MVNIDLPFHIVRIVLKYGLKVDVKGGCLLRFAWYLEVSAISVALMLLILHRLFSNFKEYKDRLYGYTCIYAIIMAIGDVYWISVDLGYFETHVVGHQYAANLIWFIGMSAAAFFWFLFCETLSGVKWTKSRKKIAISNIPSNINVIIAFASLKTGWLFNISEEGTYSRGPLIYVCFGICVAYLIYPTIHGIFVLRTEPSIRRRGYVASVISYPVLPVIAGTVQMMYPGIPLITVACAVSLMICYAALRSYDVETDALTGLKNRNGMLYAMEADIFRFKHKNAEGGTKQVALMLVDIVRLSRINREFGRVEGDNTIIKMKDILEEALSDYSCTISRFNGDRFGIVTNVSYIGELTEMENAIIKKLDEYNTQPNLRYTIGIVTGQAVYLSEMKGNPVALLSAADKNLKENRENGRLHIRRGGIA